MMSKELINFERIRTPEQFEQLQQFAKSFGHELRTDDARAPLIVVKRGERWIGFFQLINCPMFFTAWHNAECQGRDFLEAMKAMQGWAKMEAAMNNTEIAYAGVSIENAAFTPEIMEKAGMKRLFMELYGVQE